jgi:hypothetical protein
MSSGKIIKINPALFELTKKTKKNRNEKQNIFIPKPNIKTSAIKRKLLNRIKQKKTEENKINNQQKIPKINYSESDDFIDTDDLENITKEVEEDELSNAMNYFDTMSMREKEKQKILNKTYKNRNSNNISLNNLSLNIPHQLRTNSPNQDNYTLDTITSNILDDLPYGCLKNGTKPTYKIWMNSIKNYSSMANTDKIDKIRPPTPPKKHKEDKINIFTENEYKEILLEEPDKHKENILKKQINDRLKKIETEQHDMLKDVDDIEPTSGENVSNKEYIKKIIKRKYTLGKSPKYRKVGILIKGRQTKKNIINSHKKLKHTDIHQIKKYLKKRGMLKTGSSCPDEILRKIYESAMLSGEINNVNKNTLIHNFLNDDENIK